LIFNPSHSLITGCQPKGHHTTLIS